MTDAGPEPVVGDGLGGVDGKVFGGDGVGDWGGRGDGELGGVEFGDEFAEDAEHAHAGVFGVADASVGGVEVDGGELADAVGEAGCVEVGFDGADAEDEVGGFDARGDAGVTAAAGVDTAVVGEGFVDGAFAHGGYEGGEVRFGDQGVHFIDHAVAHGAGVDEDDGVFGGVEVFEDYVDDVVFFFGVVGWGGEVEWGL